MRHTLLRPTPPLLSFLSLLLACGSLGCGGGTGSSPSGADGGSVSAGEKQTGEGPCETSEECAGDVCVALIDGNNPPVYCTQECGACPSDFYCDQDTFALVGLSFCRFGSTPVEPPAPPPEPPRLPCKSDAECLEGLVCASFMGESDCTRPCSIESDCTLSLGGGIIFDLEECAPDQRPDVSRQVCLPDLECYPNVSSCISLPF